MQYMQEKKLDVIDKYIYILKFEGNEQMCKCDNVPMCQCDNSLIGK